jgi:hypothetical protein
MSWEDKFNTYLHKITEKTTTGLISDGKNKKMCYVCVMKKKCLEVMIQL